MWPHNHGTRVQVVQAHVYGGGAGLKKAKAELRDAFKRFDRDGSGKIDSRELREALRVLGMSLSATEAAELTESMDFDNDGQMNFEEFVVLAGFLKAEGIDVGWKKAYDNRVRVQRTKTANRFKGSDVVKDDCEVPCGVWCAIGSAVCCLKPGESPPAAFLRLWGSVALLVALFVLGHLAVVNASSAQDVPNCLQNVLNATGSAVNPDTNANYTDAEVLTIAESWNDLTSRTHRFGVALLIMFVGFLLKFCCEISMLSGSALENLQREAPCLSPCVGLKDLGEAVFGCASCFYCIFAILMLVSYFGINPHCGNSDETDLEMEEFRDIETVLSIFLVVFVVGNVCGGLYESCKEDKD